MNINALVIEDERADVVVIRQTLAITSAGSSQVEYATSLAEGVEKLARGGIDVVLLDLSLPDMRVLCSGYARSRAAAARQRGPLRWLRAGILRARPAHRQEGSPAAFAEGARCGSMSLNPRAAHV